MQSRNRLIFNSLAMYVKMILSLFVTFFSTRLILHNLGVESFGVYNLVAGAVSLLGFVNGSMTNSVQRFIAYELGTTTTERLIKTFNLSLTLHIICAVVLFVLLELFGLFAFDNIFVIDDLYIQDAKVSYQIVVVITLLSTLSSPFDACFNAHEDIMYLAAIEFIVSLLKLATAYWLIYFSNHKLVWYCFFLLIIQTLFILYKYLFCKKRYIECNNFIIGLNDRTILRKMVPFIGWNMVESISWLGKNQGVPIMMNTLYGTIVNAAYGIANQVNGQVMFFSSTILNAIRPQIYKAFGSGNINQAMLLSYSASKFAFYMLMTIFLPITFYMDELLVLWLQTVPAYTSWFCRIIFCIVLLNYLSIGLNIAIQGNGNIRAYQLATSVLILFSLPVGYLIFTISDNVYSLLIFMILIEFISINVKYYIASKVLHINIFKFYTNILVPCIFTCTVSFIIIYLTLNTLKTILYESMSWIINILICYCILIPVIYAIGLDKREKFVLRTTFVKFISKII